MRQRPWIIVMAGVLATPIMLRADASWPQYRGADHDGVADRATWSPTWGSDGPRVAWRAEVGPGYGTISVSDGVAYVMGWVDGQDAVQAFDAITGEPKWTHRYQASRYQRLHNGGPCATPAIHGGGVYTISRDGLMLCLDAETGQKRWEVALTERFGVEPPPLGFSPSVIVADDRLYVDVGVIAALDPENGATIWRSGDYGSAYSSPTPFLQSGRSLLAAFPASGLVVLDRQTGQEVTAFPWATQYRVNASSPVALDDGKKLLIASGYGVGGAVVDISGATPRRLWHSRAMKATAVTSVPYRGFAYTFDKAVLTCVALDDGRTMWRERGLGEGTLTRVRGHLVVLSEDGRVLIAPATPEGFEPIAQADVLPGRQCWAAPTFVNGMLYVRDERGNLACLDLRAQ